MGLRLVVVDDLVALESLLECERLVAVLALEGS